MMQSKGHRQEISDLMLCLWRNVQCKCMNSMNLSEECPKTARKRLISKRRGCFLLCLCRALFFAAHILKIVQSVVHLFDNASCDFFSHQHL